MAAERAGVSRSAVMHAFADGASVAEATRLKVMIAAQGLGYRVNHLARGLRECSKLRTGHGGPRMPVSVTSGSSCG